jgi:hypothetical protein
MWRGRSRRSGGSGGSSSAQAQGGNKVVFRHRTGTARIAMGIEKAARDSCWNQYTKLHLLFSPTTAASPRRE